MRQAGTYILGFLALLAVVLAMVWSALRPGVSPGDAVFAAAWTALAEPARDVRQWFLRAGETDPDWRAMARGVHDGDPARGAELIVAHGCGACHEIPGIRGARGSVGPSLEGLATRAYVGGVLPNEPGGLVRWIVDPTAHSPATAMPDLGVTEPEARDIAAFLFTLGGT